jgi:hypothetical protein
VLAVVAAASRTDGGAGLHALLVSAGFDVRPAMKIIIRREAA